MPEAPSASEIEETHSTESDERPPRPPIPATEMVRVAENIRAGYPEDPDFARSLEERSQQARVILEGWMKGEITLDQASEIFGAQGAELEVALEADPLMDIPNRVALERIMLEQIALARRDGKPISIAFIDLDKFGDINKRYGEDAGDATLQAVGAFLKSELERPTDKAMRRSGEELVILLPDTEEEGAMHVLQGMRERMPESVAQIVQDIAGLEFDRPITMSAGVVTQRIAQDDPRDNVEIKTQLMSQADARMRMAKENGRNRVVGTEEEARIKFDREQAEFQAASQIAKPAGDNI